MFSRKQIKVCCSLPVLNYCNALFLFETEAILGDHDNKMFISAVK